MRAGSIRGFGTFQAIPSASARAECLAIGGLEILQSLDDHLDRPIPPRDPLPPGGGLATETLLDRSRRHAADDGVARHVAGDHGARRQRRPIPRTDSRQHDHRMADPDVMPNDNAIGPP